MSEFQRRAWRKARKVRRCDDCGHKIAGGERYAYTVGKVDGELLTLSQCALCAAGSPWVWTDPA